MSPQSRPLIDARTWAAVSSEEETTRTRLHQSGIMVVNRGVNVILKLDQPKEWTLGSATSSHLNNLQTKSWTKWLAVLEPLGCRTKIDAAEVKSRANLLSQILTLLLEESAVSSTIQVLNNMELQVSRRVRPSTALDPTSLQPLVKASCKELAPTKACHQAFPQVTSLRLLP